MRTEEFDARHVPEASRLLAVRLGDDPQAEMSALPVSEEICARYIEELVSSGAAGVAVMDLHGMAGYLLASEGDNDRGRHVWTARECHAYRDNPEVLRAAYAALANRWVGDGRDHHYAVVSATDTGALNAWLELTFGHEQAHAIRDIAHPEASVDLPYEVRRAGAGDINLIEPLVRLIYEANAVAPVFTYIEPSWYDELVPGHLELLEDPKVGYFVARETEGLLGYVVMLPVSDEEATPLKPNGSIELSVAATTVEARGRGVMKALTERAFAWARDEGFSICVTDWRVANLQSSRAWPALGFKPCAYRLHRIVDPRFMAGR